MCLCVLWRPFSQWQFADAVCVDYEKCIPIENGQNGLLVGMLIKLLQTFHVLYENRYMYKIANDAVFTIHPCHHSPTQIRRENV